MAQAKGSQAKLLLDFETTYGADPAAAASIQMPFNTCDISQKRDRIVPKTITGTRNPVMPIEGNVDVMGSATVPIDAINFGYWLKALLGDPATTGAGPTYTHVFKIPETMLSCVLEMGYTDIGQYFKFNGVKINSMNIEFQAKEAELLAKLELLGASRTLDQSTYHADPDIIGVDRFQMKQIAIEEGGSSSSIVGTVTLDIKNNLDPESWVFGDGGIRGELPEQVVEVSGTLRAMFADETLLEKAVNSTESSLVITATNGANVLEITLPELKYAQADPKHVPGGIWVELPFGGYYADGADETAFMVSLTNTLEAYTIL